MYDNLVYVSELYEKVFKEDHLKETREHFAGRVAETKQYAEEIGEFRMEESDGIELFKEIEAEFMKRFEAFLSEITVARWEVLFRGKESEVQMPAALNFKPHLLLLTFDNKTIVMSQNEKEFYFEACLGDLKVSDPTEEGEIEVRDKKKK